MAPQADNDLSVRTSDYLHSMFLCLELAAGTAEPVKPAALHQMAQALEKLRDEVRHLESELDAARAEIADHQVMPRMNEALARELLREGTNVIPMSRAWTGGWRG